MFWYQIIMLHHPCLSKHWMREWERKIGRDKGIKASSIIWKVLSINYSSYWIIIMPATVFIMFISEPAFTEVFSTFEFIFRNKLFLHKRYWQRDVVKFFLCIFLLQFSAIAQCTVKIYIYVTCMFLKQFNMTSIFRYCTVAPYFFALI
jgi:hypothetical protein